MDCTDKNQQTKTGNNDDDPDRLAQSSLFPNHSDQFDINACDEDNIHLNNTKCIARRSFVKKPHGFETDPIKRKRIRTRLIKKIEHCLEEFATRVGMQIVVIIRKDKNLYSVHGTKPLENIIKMFEGMINTEMENVESQEQTNAPEDPTLFKLPPIIKDGHPASLCHLTQGELRTFVPAVIKSSTGRGKIGWGKEHLKPPWWPNGIPWANVRIDRRTAEEKERVSYTHVLRQIIANCYRYHGREDLLLLDNEHEKLYYENPMRSDDLEEAMDTDDPLLGVGEATMSKEGSKNSTEVVDKFQSVYILNTYTVVNEDQDTLSTGKIEIINDTSASSRERDTVPCSNEKITILRMSPIQFADSVDPGGQIGENQNTRNAIFSHEIDANMDLTIDQSNANEQTDSSEGTISLKNECDTENNSGSECFHFDYTSPICIDSNVLEALQNYPDSVVLLDNGTVLSYNHEEGNIQLNKDKITYIYSMDYIMKPTTDYCKFVSSFPQVEDASVSKNTKSNGNTEHITVKNDTSNEVIYLVLSPQELRVNMQD